MFHLAILSTLSGDFPRCDHVSDENWASFAATKNDMQQHLLNREEIQLGLRGPPCSDDAGVPIQHTKQVWTNESARWGNLAKAGLLFVPLASPRTLMRMRRCVKITLGTALDHTGRG